jgi:hypothetical protein
MTRTVGTPNPSYRKGSVLTGGKHKNKELFDVSSPPEGLASEAPDGSAKAKAYF